ncbi:UFL1 [Symbiodinium natans]|uniref:UFL1 protein n=1 Tax=Symbiodinium natans TaxID=878477 RepID=A0A812P7Z5_9DINO|nr:UFL1 [Symbiodinium natans]
MSISKPARSLSWQSPARITQEFRTRKGRPRHGGCCMLAATADALNTASAVMADDAMVDLNPEAVEQASAASKLTQPAHHEHRQASPQLQLGLQASSLLMLMMRTGLAMSISWQSRYNLPADYIRNSVLVLLSSTEAVIRQNAVYTGSYATRVEARVRGALRGATQPVSLAQLSARHGFDADLLPNAVQKLIKEEVVLGKLQGSTFTPKAYTEAEANKVDGFFEANGYLTAAAAKSSGLTLKEWVAQRKASGYNLGGAFIATHLVDSAMASITDALSADGWIDAQPLLPHALTAADAAELLLQLSSQKRLPGNAVVLDRVAASTGFVQGIAKAMEGEVQAAAEAATKKRGAKKSVEEEEDEGPSKKGAKRAKGGKKKRGGDDDEGAETSRAGNAESGVSNDLIANYLADQHPDLPSDIHDDLFAQVQLLLATMVAEVVDKLRSTLQTKQKHQFEQADKIVQERYERLVLGLKALEAAKLQESPLHQHLLKEVVMEPCHMLIALRLEEATGSCPEVTASSRKQSLEKLIAAEGAAKVESLSRLVAIFAKKDAKDAKEPSKEAKEKPGKSKKSQGHADEEEAAHVDVSELYHTAADDSHIFCRKVDKKKEKAAAQEQRVALKAQLKELPPSDALVVCQTGLQVALNAEGISCLVLPGELWALRLAAGCLHNEEVKEQCLKLCDLCDKEKGEDAVAREAAATAWRDRFVGS